MGEPSVERRAIKALHVRAARQRRMSEGFASHFTSTLANGTTRPTGTDPYSGTFWRWVFHQQRAAVWRMLPVA